MAGDWIKMRGNLWDDPRVAALCDATGASEATIVGGLYWVWATADQHTEDGILPGLTCKAVDRKTGIAGFGSALVAINWIADHPEGIRIINFDEHNGESAKKRCQTAKRVSKHERANAALTLVALGNDVNGVSPALPREREEKRSTTTPIGVVPAAPKVVVPSCPHREIIEAYCETLPMLPAVRPELWAGSRAKHLAARWKWVLTARTRKGEPYARDGPAGIDFFRRYFAHVARSDFLTGRNEKWLACDLGWLVSAENFAKVLQGNYDNKEAA